MVFIQNIIRSLLGDNRYIKVGKIYGFMDSWMQEMIKIRFIYFFNVIIGNIKERKWFLFYEGKMR